MIVAIIEKLRANMKTLVRVCIAVSVLIGLWGSFLVDHSHAHTVLEQVPLFWSFFGIFAGAALILVARTLARLGIMTREDYYDD